MGTYLGIDLSTQQIKAIIINDDLEVLHQTSVNFDTDLPEFRTHGGVIIDKRNPNVVTVPTLLWVKALDILMDKLTLEGVDYTTIRAISGSAQQHGSVYWNFEAKKSLKTLDSGEFLHKQLSHCFSVTNSPIWMDSSTEKECAVLEMVAGSPEKLAEITGSKAYERFAGSQIMKIVRLRPDAFNATERISLVSSFLCSLFLGFIAPLECSDASGMNLLDIYQKIWHPELVDACGGTFLADKLGKPVETCAILGNISPYYVERWNFNPECKIVAFTGDNPASLVGMGLEEDNIAISLGTSDTVIIWLKQPKVVLEGHIYCNPIKTDEYMGLLCFKNGSLTREKIRNCYTESSWDIFNQLLENTPRGNFGNLALYYPIMEILPPLQGEFRFNKANVPITKFSSLEVEVRALIEGQFIAKRAHIEDFGFEFTKNTKIFATGGASKNKFILQVLSDVFNTPVYTQEISDSAMLGAAYRAKYGLNCANNSFSEEISKKMPQSKLICEPYKDSNDIYLPMIQRYRNIVQDLVKKK